MQFAVVGIGTDVGKTIVSAILVEKFKTSYWKPVQAGELDNSDSHKTFIRRYIVYIHQLHRIMLQKSMVLTSNYPIFRYRQAKI